MVREFRFPDVGEGIAEGEIVSWLVREGDSVGRDQDLVEVETDKAVVTLPCPYAGHLLRPRGVSRELPRPGSSATTSPVQPPAHRRAGDKPEDDLAAVCEDLEQHKPDGGLKEMSRRVARRVALLRK